MGNSNTADEPEGKAPGKPADKILAIIRQAQAEHLLTLFHDQHRIAFADIVIDGRIHTFEIGGADFEHWLTGEYLERHKTAMPVQARGDAIATIEAIAVIQSPMIPTALRYFAHTDDQGMKWLYFDPIDESGDLVKIGGGEWQRIPCDASVPCRFLHTGLMLPMPFPEKGGDFDADLKTILNTMKNEEDRHNAVGAILAAMNPDLAAFPVVVITGPQGAAKSFTSRMLWGLVDEHSKGDKKPPRKTEDLFIETENVYALRYGNISAITADQSDSLAMLSTGAAFTKRKLFTDRTQARFQARRPVLLNGIGDFITRSDLLDRALLIEMDYLPDDERKTEEEVWATFKAVQPRLMGALFSAVAYAMMTDSVPVELKARLPRLADYMVWVTKCAPALGWDPMVFLNALASTSSKGDEIALEASSIGPAITTLMERHDKWVGTPAELLDELNLIGDAKKKSKDWPDKPSELGRELNRIATNMRKTLGVSVSRPRDKHHRWIELEHIGGEDLPQPTTDQQMEVGFTVVAGGRS